MVAGGKPGGGQKNTPALTRVEITRHPHPCRVSNPPPPHTPATRVGNGYPSGHPHPPPTSHCYVNAPSLEVRHRWQTAGGDALAEVRAGRGDILAGFDRWEQRRPSQGVAQGERVAAWLRWGAGSGGGMAGGSRPRAGRGGAPGRAAGVGRKERRGYVGSAISHGRSVRRCAGRRRRLDRGDRE
jgi:hypothetical protein